jgi:hypothetical protein
MLQRATVTVVLLTTALVGCSSSVTGKPTAQTGSASQSLTEDSPTTSQAADTSADIPPVGTGKVMVDGTVLNETGPVKCYPDSDYFTFGPQGDVSVNVDSLTSLNVKTVDIMAEGFEMIFDDGKVAGHATATRTGNTYRFEGEGTGNHNYGPNHMMKFTITLSCPPD